MYLKRNIDDVLAAWKEAADRKPILLRGVRQCGKTWAVRHLAEQFPSYVELNLERQQKLHAVFSGDLNVSRILARLELETGTRIIPGETLLFIDEIQTCPRAITALRYFYEDLPALHIIAAGSLLEFVLRKKANDPPVEFPVGRVRSVFMYPFSFVEYLRGMEYDTLADHLESYDPEQGENAAHELLLDHYKTFLLTGGMPEAVAKYKTTGSLLECQQIHRDLLLNFRDDFGKYDSSVSEDILWKVFDFCIHNVCNQTKASSAIQGISAYYFDESIRLLKRAGLVHPVKASACETLPLGASEKETNKKLLVFDTGVYLTATNLDAQSIIAADAFSGINKGDVVELQTGLELIKHDNSYAEAALYYWYRSGANAEVDYCVGRGNAIIPIEVKAAGKGQMQSMHAFLQSHPASPYGLRLSTEDYATYDNIRVMPVYAVSRI